MLHRDWAARSSAMSRKKRGERRQLQALLDRIEPFGYWGPFGISASERPDFILEFGARRIGVETTLATFQEYARAQHLHFTRCPKNTVKTSELKDGVRRRKNEEILRDMLNSAEPWGSHEEQMRWWRERIARCLQSKRERLSQPDYQRFDENWLLISDIPQLDDDSFAMEQACAHLVSVFAEATAARIDFDTIFIHSGNYLFRFTGSRLSLNYPGVADAWVDVSSPLA